MKRDGVRIVFIHIPKCGGLSVVEGLKQEFFPPTRRLRSLVRGRTSGLMSLNPAASLAASEATGIDVLAFRRTLLFYHLASDRFGFVFGHYPFSSAAGSAFGDRFAFVTILREPVSRFRSAYLYNRFKSSKHMRIEADLGAYLETPPARREAATLTDFLTERADRDVPPVEADVRRAAANLQHFAVVGFLDRMDAFGAALERAFGGRPSFAKTNTSPAPAAEGRAELPPSVRRRIEEMCAADIALYESARRRFGD